MAKAYTGRANSFGFLRLCFALGVVLAHTTVLGFNRGLTTVIDVPALCVAGFFGVSGFLITRSARRTSLPRYLWHRALRILPGLWGCLLFIGLIVAPSMWLLAHHTLHGLFRAHGGVLDYLRANWWGGMRQSGILDVFADTPYGRAIHGSVMDGALWTLAYEISCYLVVAVLAVTMILRKARLVVLLGGIAVVSLAVWDLYSQMRFGHPMHWTTGSNLMPLLGWLANPWLLGYGSMFLMGALAELYGDRLPINDLLGAAALLVTIVFAVHGMQTHFAWYIYFGPAVPAYTYAILWGAVRLPSFFRRIGQVNDYSYGIYIYAFVAQQLLAKLGVQMLGFVGFFAASVLGSFLCAYASWHLIEKRALRLKGWTPAFLRRFAKPQPGTHQPIKPAGHQPEPEPVVEPSTGARS